MPGDRRAQEPARRGHRGGAGRVDGDPGSTGAHPGGQQAGDDLEGGEGVVRGERYQSALHRLGVTVAERDRRELQRPAA